MAKAKSKSTSTTKKVKFSGTPGTEGNSPAKNPQRTTRQAKGGMGASLQKGRRKQSPR